MCPGELISLIKFIQCSFDTNKPQHTVLCPWLFFFQKLQCLLKMKLFVFLLCFFYRLHGSIIQKKRLLTQPIRLFPEEQFLFFLADFFFGKMHNQSAYAGHCQSDPGTDQ